MYTSDESASRFFKQNAQIINNAMAMCSVRDNHGWSNRTPNNKMEAMLTSGGQLIRKMGPLLPLNQQQPKCLQVYFYGAQEAAQFQMINTKRRFSPQEGSMFELILKNLYDILLNEVHNKYLKSFLGVKQYIDEAYENYPKEKINQTWLTLQCCLNQIITHHSDNDYNIDHISKEKLE